MAGGGLDVPGQLRPVEVPESLEAQGILLRLMGPLHPGARPPAFCAFAAGGPRIYVKKKEPSGGE